MLTDSLLWRTVADAWPPPRDSGTLARLAPEEYRRVILQPFPRLTELLDAVQLSDMPALCGAVARDSKPDAAIAHNLLHQIAAQRPELLTHEVLSEWLHAVAVAQKAVLELWHSERSDAALSALYHRFLDRVPAGVAFADLLAVLGAPTDQEALRGEHSEWATYMGAEHALQIWADPNGRYSAAKFA
jgi:hypothetical protein